MSKQPFIRMDQRWTALSVNVPIQEFKNKSRRAMIMALNRVGQEFIRTARTSGNYDDITGNLRSSIGYAIFEGGREIMSFFAPAEKDENNKGQRTGKDLAKEKADKTGLTLIVTAGMDYAGYVEAKGKNVLTIYAPTASQVKEDLTKLLKYV